MNQAATESRSGVSPDLLQDPSAPSQDSALKAPPAASTAPPRSRPGSPLATSADAWLSGRVFALLLITALFAAFPKVLLGLHTFCHPDFQFICYPQAFYERAGFLHGELPLWNPYIYCGVPFMAQLGAWYPSYFLNALFPMPWAVTFFQILHLFWAGCGMYWLMRRSGLGPFPAAFAGFAYVFNGATLSCLTWISYTAFLAWCPWVLGCTMAAWRRGGRWIALAALASAMQVLAGAPELTLLFWVLVGILWLRDLLSARNAAEATNPAMPLLFSESAEGSWKPAGRVWRPLGRLVAVVALAGGITMVQMLPFVDLLAHSQRDRNLADVKWAMPGWGWANLLLPLFHCYYVPPGGPWFQPGQYLVFSYYLGVGVLILAAAGAWLTWRRLGAILGGVALLCWVMALGSNGFVFGWVKQVFPWIGIARYPVKFALFPALLVPILAALALQAVATNTNKRARQIIGIIGATALLVMGALLWFARAYPLPADNWATTAQNAFWRAIAAVLLLGGVLWRSQNRNPVALRNGLPIGLLALVALDAFTHNPGLVPVASASTLVPGVWTLSGKPEPPKLGEGRVMTSPAGERPFDLKGPSSFELLFTSSRAAEAQSLNLLDNVPKVTGAMILRPAYFQRLLSEIYGTRAAPPNDGLVNFLSVTWSSSPQNPVAWMARTNFLPVITAGQMPAFASDGPALEAITARSFDPLQVVYLDPATRSTVTVTNRTNCRIINPRFTTHKVEAEVSADKSSLVVLSQAFYHLWRASVDGKSVPLLRANLAFQALQVPAGRHQLTLAYRDSYFQAGAVISFISLVACSLIWFRLRTAYFVDNSSPN